MTILTTVAPQFRRTPIMQKALPGMPSVEDDGSYYWYTHYVLVLGAVKLENVQELMARHLYELDNK